MMSKGFSATWRQKDRFPLQAKIRHSTRSCFCSAMCLERVNNFNFDAGVLTVHDGNGQKDRTVPLPMTLVPDLKKQLELVKNQHGCFGP